MGERLGDALFAIRQHAAPSDPLVSYSAAGAPDANRLWQLTRSGSARGSIAAHAGNDPAIAVDATQHGAAAVDTRRQRHSRTRSPLGRRFAADDTELSHAPMLAAVAAASGAAGGSHPAGATTAGGAVYNIILRAVIAAHAIIPNIQPMSIQDPVV